MSVELEEPRFAVAAPYAARWLLSQMEAGKGIPRGSTPRAHAREHAAWLRKLGHHGYAAQVESAMQQLLLAAAHHASTRDISLPPTSAPISVISADGNGQTEIDGLAGTCDQQAEITTQEAAHMLGFNSTRRVLQLIGDGSLEGRKVGRSWLVDRASVEQLRDIGRAS